ncbi:VOC family protein [Roseibium sediminis]|uniref:VOC family protein n=1 Tax=Roseibium sediminis TaxID=1775174 RepID=UPI00123D81D2|nr:VOC family protein [Roseibium sediminis]
MEQRLSMVTLSVQDVAETRRFFEQGLGWKANNFESDDIVFFQTGGSVLAIYSRQALERDLGQAATQSLGAMTIAWNARTESEVDEVFSQAMRAGAISVSRPARAFWGGYSSHVEIPGGHLLEIAYNPFWSIDDAGNVTIPEGT